MFLNRMTENSKFILHWEIDNATARFATDKVESGVFDKGGFRWTAAVERHDNKAQISLRCDLDHNRAWKCEAEVELHVLSSVGYINWNKGSFCFIGNSAHVLYNTANDWTSLFTGQEYKVNDKVTFEFRINVINADRPPDLTVFASPNDKSNVILKIGDEKLHVYKELLALYSPVFDTLFFGDFAEKGKEEVEIKDVVYEEFLDLLHLINLEQVEITDRSVSHILKLADQFQMERVLTLAKKHLTQSKGLDVMTKLLLADQYRLTSVKEQCLNSFTSATELLVKLKSSAYFANFSSDMKDALLERAMKLT